jgi:hypothetical protein
MCGVGKFMKRWKLSQNSACPRCGEVEDAPHVWTCQGSGVNDLWTIALSNLVPRGDVVQILQISGVKSGVIWTKS